METIFTKFNSLEISLLVVLVIIILVLVIILIARIFIKHKKHSLYYHKYNAFLNKSETIYNMSLKDKKFSIHENNKLLYSDLIKNVNNFYIVNSNCLDLINANRKNHKKRQKDMLFDLEALQNLPKLAKLKYFEDPHDPKLLKDIFIRLFKIKKCPIVDEYIVSCFGRKQYFKVGRDIVYLYNNCLIFLKATKNHLIEPKLYMYEDLDIQFELEKQRSLVSIFKLVVRYEDNILFTETFDYLKPELKNIHVIINLIDSLAIYQNCATIKDAVQKHQHIEKVNINTMNKIETMQGRKFLTWVQSALKSLYKVEVEFKSDSNLGSYLIMSKSKKHGTVAICCKRQQEKVAPSQIKRLKDIQIKENTDEAWIITNNEFTHNAIVLADSLNIKLISNEQLKHIINKYNSNYYQSF